MIFASGTFIFAFLPVVLIVCAILQRYNQSKTVMLVWLTLASIFFYAYWKFSYIYILLASIGVNYLISQVLERAREKIGQNGKQTKLILFVGIVFNLALIGYYKYADLAIETANYLTANSYDALNILLPIGISFFTFQQIAFLVDIYQGKAKPTSVLRYSFFVAFFPQLIAGPIIHHRHVLPKIDEPGVLQVSTMSILAGLPVFFIGLFKKVVIADTFATFATTSFQMADAGTLDMVTSTIGALAYTLQIYFDFSGYSDMAIGLGLMMGLQLPQNFNSPYKSSTIVEFWRRWHMTLSEFLRDYLYIPFGGNRVGQVRRYANLMATMLIGGLWHGASWAFVLWGGLHGLYLLINHAWSKYKPFTFPHPLAVFITLIFVIIAWIPFRAEKLSTSLAYFAGFSVWPEKGIYPTLLTKFAGYQVITILGMLLAGFIVCWLLPNSWQWQERYRNGTERFASRYIIGTTILGGIALFVMVYFTNRVSEFIYFNF